MKHIHPYQWIQSVYAWSLYKCEAFQLHHDFINVCRYWGLCQASLFWFLISRLSFATGCNICVFVCVWKHVQYICCSLCVFFTILEVCFVWKMEGEGFISEDISVPCLQPEGFFLWFDLFFFHVLCFSCIIRLLWYTVLVPGVAGLIRWTLQHWKLFLLGFDMRSAPLYFARPPLAAFTFVSPLLVRPRY